MCAGCGSSGQFTDNNGAQSDTGSVAENSKYTGASSTDEKFEGQHPGSEANPRIGNVGWGN
jgi:hypothetical protein